MHFLILPDQQNLFFKKDVFERLEWLKTCFDAFSHTSRRTEKVSEKKDIFERLEWLKKTCFDAFAHTSRPAKSFFQKRCFGTSVVVKNGF